MKQWFLIFVSTIVFMSCAKSTDQQETTQLEAAMFAINNQQYDQAITILSALPISDTTKDLLSTAYAGRAGFNAAKIADLIATEPDSIRVLYSLTTKYSIQNILDSQSAINQIYSSLPVDQGKESINVKYASIQVYKISQILVKNYIKFGDQSNSQVEQWSPCSDAELLGSDLREIIISVNRAVVATKNIETKIYDYLISLQKELNINPDLFEDTVVKNTDIANARDAISKEFYKHMGQTNEDVYTCSSTSGQ
jgi:ATP-dependent Lon protease